MASFTFTLSRYRRDALWALWLDVRITVRTDGDGPGGKRQTQTVRCGAVRDLSWDGKGVKREDFIPDVVWVRRADGWLVPLDRAEDPEA